MKGYVWKIFYLIFVLLFIKPLNTNILDSSLNHALDKPVTGSTRDASRAVNSCVSNAQKFPCCCCFTTDTAWNPWIAVDLRVPVQIERIKIYGTLSTGPASRLLWSNTLWILLTNESVVTTEHLNKSQFTEHQLHPEDMGVFDIRPTDTASHVVVKRFDTESMTICEIEVYGECMDLEIPCLHQNCSTKERRRCVPSCQMGYYGRGCDEPCGECEKNECDSLDGTCLQGCKVGFHGTHCREGCTNGTWGKNCINKCGQCSKTCTVEGFCMNGCQPGWQGFYCTNKCAAHTYGQGCQHQCSNCRDDIICDHVTGSCNGSCAVGWFGDMCSQPCFEGSYGRNCEHRCGNCMIDGCNKDTGFCDPAKCQPGWTGVRCDRTCSNFSYGEDCSEKCGFCKESQPCTITTGICPQGCEVGFEGEFCNTFKQKESKSYVYLLIFVAAAVFVTLLIASVYNHGRKQRAPTSSSGNKM